MNSTSPLHLLRSWYSAAVLAAAGAVAFLLYRFGGQLLSGRFLPHRYCYLARPDLIWANVTTDSVISLSYVAIFFSLVMVAWRSRHVLAGTMYGFLLAFSVFILACGMTHVMETVVIWYPFYWLAVAVKLVTAIASAGTAAALLMKQRFMVEAVETYKVRLATSEAERQQAVQALVTADKLAMIGRLSASISHEINNPLDAVQNVIYCTREHPDLPEDLKFLVAAADAELKRIAEITHSTLSFYRDTAAPETVDLRDVVQGSLDLMQRRARDRGVVLSSAFEGQLRIEAFGGEVRQVVINLVRNAIEASGTGTTVQVKVSPAQDEHIGAAGYNLEVEDQGCGIAQGFLPNLFRPSTSTKANGNGLGLWIVRQIIEKHGGTVRVDSRTTAPAGTKFVVWLPVQFASGTMQGLAFSGAEAMAV